MSKLKVYVSGGSHLSGSDSRVERIKSKLGEQPDVIFCENAENQPPSFREKLLNWITAPLLIIGISFIFKIWDIAEVFGYSDAKIVNKLPESKVEDIDQHYQHHITENRKIWGLTHYLVSFFVFLGIVYLTIYLNIQSSIMIGLFLLLIPLIVSQPFMAGILLTRDYIMYKDIEEFALDNDEHDTACAIVGGSHEERIKQMIDNSRHLELVE